MSRHARQHFKLSSNFPNIKYAATSRPSLKLDKIFVQNGSVSVPKENLYFSSQFHLDLTCFMANVSLVKACLKLSEMFHNLIVVFMDDCNRHTL